ncbi:hypothetical protein HPB50_013868 [Hyalomma asiaticum]|uniref:Uncharacterized protein n=1 Tax=Hyalomma asiaticum TaxID=266040 RepID=A0ACB7RNK3_HYAAI|nr:hypothetical protein HPB50_013868 [Hyalomma asiaticum]
MASAQENSHQESCTVMGSPRCACEGSTVNGAAAAISNQRQWSLDRGDGGDVDTTGGTDTESSFTCELPALAEGQLHLQVEPVSSPTKSKE